MWEENAAFRRAVRNCCSAEGGRHEMHPSPQISSGNDQDRVLWKKAQISHNQYDKLCCAERNCGAGKRSHVAYYLITRGAAGPLRDQLGGLSTPVKYLSPRWFALPWRCQGCGTRLLWYGGNKPPFRSVERFAKPKSLYLSGSGKRGERLPCSPGCRAAASGLCQCIGFVWHGFGSGGGGRGGVQGWLL